MERDMFKTVKNKMKFEIVLDQIKELLATKQMKVGQKMPTEMQLAESLGVSRTSLREALKILSFLGMIESKTGEGAVIKEANLDNLKSLMSLIAVSKGLDAGELCEMRIMLEIHSVSLAASRRSDEDLAEIKQYLIQMDSEDVDKQRQSDLDHLFHISIAKVSRNNLLVMVMELISGLLKEQIRETRNKLSEDSAVIRRFQREHWEIFEAIEDRNAETASNRVFNHLTRTHHDLGIHSLGEKSINRKAANFTL